MNTVRKIDTVARFGGDEFVIVLHELGTDLEKSELIAKDIASKLLASIRKEIFINDQKHIINASIGISMFNGFTKPAETIILETDMAMYQAKQEGRNRYVLYHPIIRSENIALNTLLYELRIAIECNQFILYYQPQFNTNLTLFGVEALLRWQHPTRGLLTPAEFLSIAEQSEYIHLLGNKITEMALSQLALWQESEDTKHLMMSINISPRQFEKDDFFDEFYKLISKYKIDTSRLILELTETALTLDIDQIIKKFNQIRDLGILLSIDDFGTGHSSLGYLFQLPIQQLKIDRSFIQNIVEDRQLQIITKAIISLGKNLDLFVVAEGIETKGQEQWLIENSCDILQGNLYARALPVVELKLFINELKNK